MSFPMDTGVVATAIVTATITATPSTSPTLAAAPVAGDADNTQHATTSSVVMIIIGCILGILGVAGVIFLIWWMRRRALAQQTYIISDVPGRHPPLPPVKPAALAAQKNLPAINVKSMSPATRPARSGSADKDKALPIKPPESVWSPTAPRSPALASVHEMTTSPRGRNEEEAKQARERSTSVGSYKAPQTFI